MNNLQIFEKMQFGQIRMVEIDNKPYFVGKDVAEKLGYKNTNDAILRHCKGVIKLNKEKIAKFYSSKWRINPLIDTQKDLACSLSDVKGNYPAYLRKEYENLEEAFNKLIDGEGKFLSEL